MTDDELAQIIVQASFDLHRELGPGLFGGALLKGNIERIVNGPAEAQA